MNEVCVAVPCIDDEDCDAPLVCSDGACIQPACDRCPSGYHCVDGLFPDGDHVCASDRCHDAADCSAGLVCADGACTVDVVFCTEDDQCPSGRCAITASTFPEGDCDGEPCPTALGTCVPPGGCASDADCATGQHCENLACVDGPGPCTSDADCAVGTCNVETGACLDPGGCVADSECPAGQTCVSGRCGVVETCTSDEACGAGLRCIHSACTDCAPDDCDVPPPGPDGGPGPGSGSDGGPGPGVDAGVPFPDGGIHVHDAGIRICPLSCGQRKGYHLLCPTTGIGTPSWCPASPSCSAMDSCQASQLAACNASCPGGCVTIPDGPWSCCDCAPPTIEVGR